MDKPIDFATYRSVQKMSYNGFNRFAVSMYNSGLQDGINIVRDDVAAELTDDRLYDIIRSVKGIGEKRAREVVDKVLSEGLFNGD